MTWREYETGLEDRLIDLHNRVHRRAYRAQPSRRVYIPKADGRQRSLGIAALEDKIVQQAVVTTLNQIYEVDFKGFSYGFRPGRDPHQALDALYVGLLRKRVNWVLDADIRGFFGSVNHEKLLTLVAQQVADGRVLRLIRAMLKAGSWCEGRLSPTERGTPQGGVISPLLSNVLLTPFDREMRAQGYQLTRYADDWVVTCESEEEARAAVTAAERILAQLGVQLHSQKTRIVHIHRGFEFLGYKIKQGRPRAALQRRKLGRNGPAGKVYAYPRQKSIDRFKDQIRQRTKRRVPLSTEQIIAELNPIVRGWGQYYKRSHARKLFTQLDAWIVRRLWSHRCKRWRCEGWKQLPQTRLYGELELVSLLKLHLQTRSP